MNDEGSDPQERGRVRLSFDRPKTVEDVELGRD